MKGFRQFMKLTTIELTLTLREPIAVFFAFVFPTFFLFLTMEVFIAPDVPREVVINYVMPSMMFLVIASTAIFGVPGTVASYREMKFLKRLKASPVTPLVLLSSFSVGNFILALLGVLLLIAVAMLVYGASFAGNPLSFFIGLCLSCVSLSAVFFFISAVGRVRTSYIIAQIVFFPVMFFSGVFIPLDRLPAWIAHYISPLVPVTHAAELMQGLWLGTSLTDLINPVVVLLAMTCVGLVIGARTFRWE